MTRVYGRQAITTKYCGPTNHRSSRVIAKCNAGRLVWSWDDTLDATANHVAAAHALATRLEWHGTWACGSNHTGCYVFVMVADGRTTFTVVGAQ